MIASAVLTFVAIAEAPSSISNPSANRLKPYGPPRDPDHLEPLRGYDPDGYSQAVFESLIGYDLGELWMVSLPSFRPESAVVLRHVVTYSDPTKPSSRTITSEEWVIERVQVEKQIWRWKELEGGRMQLDIEATKDVIRQRATVSKEFALQMVAVWESVLRRTRYKDQDSGVLDGVTYQFYCRHNFFGEVANPRAGLPKMLTELGLRLADLAKADNKVHPKLTAECIDLAEKITSEVQKLEEADDGQ